MDGGLNGFSVGWEGINFNFGRTAQGVILVAMLLLKCRPRAEGAAKRLRQYHPKVSCEMDGNTKSCLAFVELFTNLKPTPTHHTHT